MKRMVLPRLERRLQERYKMLVEEHYHAAERVAAGIRIPPGASSPLAVTQAAWRFLNHEGISLAVLAEPLQEEARQGLAKTEARFGLVVLDWSILEFNQPRRKRDLIRLGKKRTLGYELMTALLVSADNGAPLAPVEMHLRTAKGIVGTYPCEGLVESHLDQVFPVMMAVRELGLSKPVVYVIDREGDSVDHYRRWDEMGEKFLVRGDDRRVRWGDGSYLLSEIRREFLKRKRFRYVCDGKYRERRVEIWAAETEVILDRPAKKNVKDIRYRVPGRPIPLRAVFVEIRTKGRKRLAHWELLSNVPVEWAGTDKLAMCYYWRWQIESYFKLLKSHGHQIEQWQQATGEAIARRLLIAAMACVVVWLLQADQTARAEEFKEFLVRLSGRQTKRQRRYTAPAMLAGLWIFLAILEALKQYTVEDLQRFAEQLPRFDPGYV